MTRVLITTRLRDPHQKLNVDNIFLGSWAINSHEKNLLVKPLILDYHWDDREKLFKDYEYLQRTYKKISIYLYEKLNSLHSTSHSYKYWQMVVGPWLNQFIQIYFDRWFMLSMAAQKFPQLEMQGILLEDCDISTNDMVDFENKCIDDIWNSRIYCEIATFFKNKIKISKIYPNPEKNKSDNKRINLKNSLRLIIKKSIPSVITQKFVRMLLGVSQLIYTKNEIFLFQTFMELKSECRLFIKLRQLPKIWSNVECPEFSYERKFRDWSLGIDKEKLENKIFESLLIKHISQHIPKVYLEGYAWLASKVNEVHWPKNPSTIFTSNAFYSADFFKVWAANKVEKNGCRYVIGQHGGGYGAWKFDSCLAHEIEISDSFISWGWENKAGGKIFPLGNLKCHGYKLSPNPLGKGLLVFTSLPRFSYRLYSVPVSSSQMEQYFNDHLRFLSALQEGVRNQIIIRTYSNDYGYEEKKFLSERLKNLNFDNNEKGIYDLMNDARICVCTYNATTYLETLYFNFPTIAYWNKSHSETQLEVDYLFNLIRSVGILHDSPESAASHLNTIWNHIDEWWQNVEVQNARKIFCEKFSRKNQVLLDDVANLLKKMGDN
jgi:putative transferase (TIGR04331 family)